MPSDIVSKVVSKVGSIVPDDDSDTDDFVARDTVSADADRQQQAEARPHSPPALSLSLPCRAEDGGCCWQMQLLVLLLSLLVFLLISVALCWYRYSTMVQVRPPLPNPKPHAPLSCC